MKTPEQIAAETAEKAIAFVEGTVREWLPRGEFAAKRDELAASILAALTEHAKGLEDENARRSFPHPELYNTRKLLGDVTAERDKLRARVAELEAQRNDAREYGARMQRELGDWKEVAGQHCADAAKLEQQLHAMRLVCGTTDANKFDTALDRANERIAQLELQTFDIKKLEADKERLDWLLTNDGQEWHYFRNMEHGPRADRAAIDAARNAQPAANTGANHRTP